MPQRAELGSEILVAPVVGLAMIDSMLMRNCSDGIRSARRLAGNIQIGKPHSKSDCLVRETRFFRVDYGLLENRRDRAAHHDSVSFAEAARVLAVAEAAVGKKIRSSWLTLNCHME